jgi:putative ATP-dependent endonuclease of OLD family
MFIECLIPSNFRCFGPETPPIDLSPALTAFVGSNGSGKTAVMQALQRLFGVTGEQRRVRRQDFHIPAPEKESAQQRSFTIEVIIAFMPRSGLCRARPIIAGCAYGAAAHRLSRPRHNP